MKIVSWNVNGIRACSQKGFLEFIQREDPDILCIQETKAHPEQLDEALVHPLGRIGYFSSAEKRGYSGTATFCKTAPDNVEFGIKIRKFDNEGRFVVTQQNGFTLYNVYFPNGAMNGDRHNYKMEFLFKFTKHLKNEIDRGESLVVVGDYNVAYLDHDVFDPVRLSKVSGFLPEERAWFVEFLNSGFIDTFRYFYPELKDTYTWWSYRENARIANRGWRIDHICVTQNLIKKVHQVRILDHQLGSDHCPIAMEMKKNETS